MNNEEKNITPENEGVEVNNATEQSGGKKGISGGLLAAIIGGVAVVILAVILLVVLLPGKNSGNTGDGGDGSGDIQPETKVTYTVTVVDEDGNPVKGALIQFNPKSGTSFPLPTGADGKASYRTDKEMASVEVFTVPAGYEYDKLNQKQTLDSEGKLTVTLTKKAVEGTNYTIRVIDQEGNPVANVKVQICESQDGGLCLTPIKSTDENGVIVYTAKEAEYKATINLLPEGYEKVGDEYTYFENGATSITITVKKIAD